MAGAGLCQPHHNPLIIFFIIIIVIIIIILFVLTRRGWGRSRASRPYR